MNPDRLMHVVLLFDNKQIWQVESWQKVNAEIKALTEDSLSAPMYVFVRSPLKRLIHSFWAHRCKQWAETNHIGLDHVGALYRDIKTFKNELGILNEDITNIFVWQDGQIDFCAQGVYSSRLHLKAIKECLQTRQLNIDKITH